MTLNDYQKDAMSTAVYSASYKLAYPILGLNGEAGEVANTYKKALRNQDGYISEVTRKLLIEELGDCLWYIAAVANDLATDLGEVARINIEKLKERQRLNQLREHDLREHEE